MATVIAAIGTAAASAGTAAAAAGITASGLSTAFSIGSALASIGSGIAASNQKKTEAAWARTEGEQELEKGAEQARDLSREYAALRSEQDVIQLANGLDIGVGTPVNIAKSTQRIAQQNLSKTRENARNRYRMSRLRSRGLMAEGRA
ncbi:MAG: hypothetical protein KAJ19_29460, partial [Gammaproteobacteria bacterium]|nr:hypothetical protein [Gammaproteobacteria bacterium]